MLGYPDAGSVQCGDAVGVHLSGPAGQLHLAAYRIGWYGGAGSRRVWLSRSVRVVPRAEPKVTASPSLVLPTWPVTVTLSVDGGWPPGFYLLTPIGAHGPVGAVIPLVVRDATGSAPVLFMASTLTWNAYGSWGGRSLYTGPGRTQPQQVANRARVVALHRPLTGSGYRQMLSMDLPVARFAERVAARDGLNVAYTTDVDVDARPEQLIRPAVLVIGGHSEYWTTKMYDGLLAARDAGVNVAFLGANNLWWHARLESAPTTSGGSTTAPDREVVYRVLAEDPAARTDPSMATVLWQGAPLRREPAAVLGQSHAAIGIRSGGLQVLAAPAWFTAGTGLHTGSTLPGVVGNEADGYNPRGHNPAATQVLAAGVLLGAGGPVTVSISYSTVPSGSALFAAGTTDWACALGTGCSDTVTTAATRALVVALTRNVLLALSSRRAGITHPAANAPVPEPAILQKRLVSPAIGRYGAPDED